VNQPTDWMWTRATGSGHIAHKLIDDRPVPYWEIPLPKGFAGLLFRIFHRCYAQTKGVFGWEIIERCPCGGVRNADLPPTEPRSGIPVGEYPFGPWFDRNTMFTGDAVAYMGGIRPLADSIGGV
jgi:hypothetical protein